MTFLRVLGEAPRGEWEEWRIGGRWHAWFAAWWRTGRVRRLLASVRVCCCEAVAVVNAFVVVDVDVALASKARDMFALILAVWNGFGTWNVDVSKRWTL